MKEYMRNELEISFTNTDSYTLGLVA